MFLGAVLLVRFCSIFRGGCKNQCLLLAYQVVKFKIKARPQYRAERQPKGVEVNLRMLPGQLEAPRLQAESRKGSPNFHANWG